MRTASALPSFLTRSKSPPSVSSSLATRSTSKPISWQSMSSSSSNPTSQIPNPKFVIRISSFLLMPSPRQTVSYLTARFREAGIRPDVRHGQNFLIDLNLLDLLLNAADIQPTDVVLEVGTGMGSLTSRLAEKAAAVVTVEIDSRLFAMASEELADFQNVVMLQKDALKSKNHLEPEVIAVVKEELERDERRRLKLVANLPYNIATPILSNLLTADVVPLS